MLFADSFAILIHGYTLQAYKQFISSKEIGPRSWNNVVWGQPEFQLMGRIPFGMYLSLLHKPLRIIFGSGASCIFNNKPITRLKWNELKKPANVEWESDFSLRYLIDNFDRLLEFEKIKPLIEKLGGASKARNYIEAVTETNNDSNNTKEEIENALSICDKWDIKILLRVTNPSHEPRCVSIQNNLLKNYSGSVEQIFSIPSETDFSEGEQVLVFEPPSGFKKKGEKNHCKILKPYFNVDDNVREKFLDLADEYFSPYTEKHVLNPNSLESQV